jgi:hypothetical protein
MKSELPQPVKMCMWSYDTSKINPNEYLMRDEKDFKLSEETDDLWLIGGHTAYNTLLQETEPRAFTRLKNK